MMSWRSFQGCSFQPCWIFLSSAGCKWQNHENIIFSCVARGKGLGQCKWGYSSDGSVGMAGNPSSSLLATSLPTSRWSALLCSMCLVSFQQASIVMLIWWLHRLPERQKERDGEERHMTGGIFWVAYYLCNFLLIKASIKAKPYSRVLEMPKKLNKY